MTIITSIQHSSLTLRLICVTLILHVSRISSFTIDNSSHKFQRLVALKSSSSPRSSSRQPSNRERGSGTSAVGPKAEARQRRSRNRSSTISSTEEKIFDPQKLTSLQSPNENAVPFDVHSDTSSLQIRTAPSANEVIVDLDSASVSVQEQDDTTSVVPSPSSSACCTKGKPVSHAHFQQMSLDELFPNLNFSQTFYRNGTFREEIRQAIRNDIFCTTPAYASLSPKVASFMLDDDSSLQGSWNCVPKDFVKEENSPPPLRMARLTTVLKDTLGEDAPTGDEFMMKIGGLCGVNPSNHWIDIIGVKDRVVSHSWHQDTGKSYDENDVDSEGGDVGDNLQRSRYTVMLGFPQEDEYEGTGVFSHAIKLTNEHLAHSSHNENEPVLFEGTINEDHVVRPSFSFGKELLIYRDVDTLHSAPDVVYRKSVMRFM